MVQLKSFHSSYLKLRQHLFENLLVLGGRFQLQNSDQIFDADDIESLIFVVTMDAVEEEEWN